MNEEASENTKIVTNKLHFVDVHHTLIVIHGSERFWKKLTCHVMIYNFYLEYLNKSYIKLIYACIKLKILMIIWLRMDHKKTRL